MLIGGVNGGGVERTVKKILLQSEYNLTTPSIEHRSKTSQPSLV